MPHPALSPPSTWSYAPAYPDTYSAFPRANANSRQVAMEEGWGKLGARGCGTRDWELGVTWREGELSSSSLTFLPLPCPFFFFQSLALTIFIFLAVIGCALSALSRTCGVRRQALAQHLRWMRESAMPAMSSSTRGARTTRALVDTRPIGLLCNGDSGTGPCGLHVECGWILSRWFHRARLRPTSASCCLPELSQTLLARAFLLGHRFLSFSFSLLCFKALPGFGILLGGRFLGMRRPRAWSQRRPTFYLTRRILEKQANRAALVFVLTSWHRKLRPYFGNGEDRVQRLELLRTPGPTSPKLTQTTELANTGRQAFKDIVDLVTLFPWFGYLFSVQDV
ncbi:hypothetical protein B0H14DRAFT_3540861 [Mycena olivaceomarginata]|nr:hypothetical protein B0H14DRAFT_3540861 [Mycena olivaceomarginata]